MSTAILFDTETTGLLVPSINRLDAQPYIIEMYALKIDDDTFETIDEYYSKFLPPIPIPQEVSRIHGITDEVVSKCPTFDESVDEISTFFEGASVLIAHNLPFDRSMLANELLRCDRILQFPWPRIHYCTVEHSMFIEQRRMNLSSLYEHVTGKKLIDAHRAANDVAALRDCYRFLVTRERVLAENKAGRVG